MYRCVGRKEGPLPATLPLPCTPPTVGALPPLQATCHANRGVQRGRGMQTVFACPFPLWPRGPYVHNRPCAPCVLGEGAPSRAWGLHHPAACANGECRQHAKGTPCLFLPLAPTQSNRRASTGPPPCRRSPLTPPLFMHEQGSCLGPNRAQKRGHAA
jgi:hypothetical protein